jgi:hypothetical protein
VSGTNIQFTFKYLLTRSLSIYVASQHKYWNVMIPAVVCDVAHTPLFTGHVLTRYIRVLLAGFHPLPVPFACKLNHGVEAELWPVGSTCPLRCMLRFQVEGSTEMVVAIVKCLVDRLEYKSSEPANSFDMVNA